MGGGIAAAKGPLKAGRFKRIALVSIWVSGGGSLFRQHRLTICPLHTAEEEGAFAVSQHGFNGDGHPVGVAGQHRLGELLDELHLLRLRAKAGRQSVHSFLQHPRGAGGAQGGGRAAAAITRPHFRRGVRDWPGLGGRQQPWPSWPASVPQRRPGMVQGVSIVVFHANPSLSNRVFSRRRPRCRREATADGGLPQHPGDLLGGVALVVVQIDHRPVLGRQQVHRRQ